MTLRYLIPLTSLIASAHICMFSPRQRGVLNDPLMPGDPSCYRRTGYCGGVAPGAPSAKYVAGQEIDVLFQQNLNHWMNTRPGYFDISIAYTRDPSNDDFETLARMSDYAAHDQVFQSNFTLTVKLPPKSTSHGVIRLRYVSNNPDEIDPKNNTDAVFYNCADVEILADPSMKIRGNNVAREDGRGCRCIEEPTTCPAGTSAKKTGNCGNHGQYPYYCCVKESGLIGLLNPTYLQNRKEAACSLPEQFTFSAHETNEHGVAVHTVYWDGASGMTRWDRSGRFFGSAVERRMSLINDYNKSIEYVYLADEDKCSLYGPDQYYSWTYGPGAGHTSHNRTFVGDTETVVDTWWGGGNGARFVTSPILNDAGSQLFNHEGLPLCRPIAWNIGGKYFAVFDFKSVTPEPDVFIPSKSCKRKPLFVGCNANRTRTAFYQL